MNTTNFDPARVQTIFATVNNSIISLSKKEVQVMVLTNGQAVTVELSAFNKNLKTISVVIFPGDYEKKVDFLSNLLWRLENASNPYAVIVASDKEYSTKFVF